MVRRIPLAALCVCTMLAVASLVALRRFRLPAPTGPYAVGTRILDLTDASRHEDGSSDPSAKRELVVQLWYPAEASQQPFAPYQRWKETKLSAGYLALIQTNSRLDTPVAKSGAPFPVLIFGHRWNGERTQNTDLAEELASRGYVVVAVDHPYNSSRVLMGDGRVIVGTQQLEGPLGATATATQQIDFWNRTMDVWAADDLFVLNELAAKNLDGTDPLYGRLNTNVVGAYGHSFGGAVALRLCGLDSRVKGAVNLDGWTFGGLKSRTAAQAVMVFDEAAANERRQQLLTLPQPGSVDDQMDRADDATVRAGLKADGGYRVYIDGTQHLDFSDQPLLPPLHRGSFTGPIAPAEIQKILREMVVGFFDQTLRGTSSAVLDPRQKAFKAVKIERWPRDTAK